MNQPSGNKQLIRATWGLNNIQIPIMKTLFIWLSLAFCIPAQASHVIGADITYTHKGNKVYHVVYSIYRECAGLPLQNVQFFVSKGDGSSPISISPNRTAIKDISVVCKNDTLPCKPQNTNTNSGVECHSYEIDLDLKHSSFTTVMTNNCQVLFSMSICCRNGAITTLSPDNMYLESMVDVCLAGNKGNTSPRFGFNPIKSICCNNYFLYNVGAIEDTDADSLGFRSVPALKNFNDSALYTGTFSSRIPMTPYCPPNPGVINCRALPGAKPPRGFYFNAYNGDITFTPNKCDEVGVMVMQVDEWRKDSIGVLRRVGYIKRESTWFVSTCSDNNAPNISGNNQYAVCEGNKICFTVSSMDDQFLPKQLSPDTLQLYWDSGIKMATFRIIDPMAREKQAEFCWQTKLGDAKIAPYRFTVQVDDQHCSPPLKSFKTYTVQVKPKAKDYLTYQYLFKGGLVIVAQPSDSTVKSSYRYVNALYNDSMKLIHYGLNKSYDTIVFTSPGTYVLEHQVNQVPYNCPSTYFDTLVITQAHLLKIHELYTNAISLYPLPSSGLIRVDLSKSGFEAVDYSVFDVHGKQIQTGRINATNSTISHLPQGQFILRLQEGNWMEQKQIIVAY